MVQLIKSQELPLPPFFKPEHARQWSYNPNVMDLAKLAPAWGNQYDVKPSAADEFRLNVLIIDGQKDFCFPDGTLYVGGRSGTGAMDDNERTASFIYRNLPHITDIRCTFDTHFLFQIFSAWFWQTKEGKSLDPHTMIVIDDRNGQIQLNNVLPDGTLLHEGVVPNPAVTKWLASGNYAWLLEQVKFYCQELAREGKYVLYLWPPHCLLGSDGHALAGVIQEARIFHGLVRNSQSWSEVKGGNFLTENYSVFRPEVLMRWDGKALAQRNTRFLEQAMDSDGTVLMGQAASHCVKSSIDDILAEILSTNPDLARKFFVVTDCMSAVAVPDGQGGFLADFTPQAEEAFDKYRAAGMHLVKSTDPLESWPGLGK